MIDYQRFSCITFDETILSTIRKKCIDSEKNKDRIWISLDSIALDFSFRNMTLNIQNLVVIIIQ